MEGTGYITYAEWLTLLETVQKKGMACREFEQLKTVYPLKAGNSYEPLIHNGLAKLETCLLTKIFARFEKAMNLCLEETDLEIAETAIQNLRKNLKACLFFNGVPEYPESVKNSMNQEIHENITQFWQEYTKYLKKLSYADQGTFVTDLIYLCRKIKIDKVVWE